MSVCAGIFESVAVFVTVNVVSATIVRSACAGRVGGVLVVFTTSEVTYRSSKVATCGESIYMCAPNAPWV